MRFKKGDVLTVNQYARKKKTEVYLLVGTEPSVYNGFYKALNTKGEIVLLNLALCELVTTGFKRKGESNV